MEKALWNSGRENSAKAVAAEGKRLDWRRKMSDHIAYALLGYTGLQIFVTMSALESDGESILPFFALILLVAAIIPGARWVESRWEGLSDQEAADPALARAFNRDRLMVWIVALGLPFVVTGVIRGAELFA